MRLFRISAFVLSAGLLMISEGIADNVYDLIRQGNELTHEQATALEDKLKTDVDDVESRSKLLGYYLITGRAQPEAKSAKLAHVLWLIENSPDAGILRLPHAHLSAILESKGYAQVKEAWLKAVKSSPENPAVHRNAASFFLLNDSDLAEELLLKGQKIDPENPDWSLSLGQLNSLKLSRLVSADEKRSAPEKAFRHYEKGYELGDENMRSYVLPDLAKSAMNAGLHEEAKKYATIMLENDEAGPNHGNCIHHGNLILGRVALSEGKIEEAKSRLILAGMTPGSPNLNSFGPNMKLAKDLLEKGETEAVLQYLELCKKFWKSPRRKADEWIVDIKSGRKPQFGANLFY